MNKAQTRRVLGNLALAVVSLSICLALAEVVLRSTFTLDTGRSQEFRIPHSEFGWVLEPDASYLYKLPETSERVRYKSTGWRDVNHAFEKDVGTFRILVLGDSFMDAYSVTLPQSFHKQIEQIVSDQGIEVEVINLGVGGYGTLQEYLAFRDVGQLYEPDLVLLGFYIGNDVTNNSMELESMINRGVFGQMVPGWEIPNFSCYT